MATVDVLKLALEALENINNTMPFPVGSQAITAIKEKLKELNDNK